AWLARGGRLPMAMAAAIALAVAPFVSAFVFFPYLLVALPLVVVLILGDGPLWLRIAGVAAWLLFQVQAVVWEEFPSGALGVAIAVAATLMMAVRSRPVPTPELL
ncbi:MAG: hypothetical protein M3O64_06845, partial [Chloroflexota bacterium]|nr:hypothetical protein [Chloroflexota bacterium]